MPGKYKFEILATYLSHAATSKPINFEFNIARPWWDEWWFYFMVCIGVISILLIIYRFRIKQLMKMEKMRRKISSDLHDDIGATLSSINIYTELARKEKESNLYINLIEAHSTEVIEKLDDLVWSINPNNDSFEQLKNRMRSFAEPLLHASGIQCSINFNENIFRLTIDIDIKTNIFLIFKELVNNVAKHSKATHCNIDIYKDSKWLCMEIKDNGIGFNPDQKSDRNGLNNLIVRVNEIKASMLIETAPNKGTKVKISIPV
jgi:signal transduction histidine kinase